MLLLYCCCFCCNRALVKNVNFKTYWPREREQERERAREEGEEASVREVVRRRECCNKDNNVLWLLLLSLCQYLYNFLVFCYCGFLHYCVYAFSHVYVIYMYVCVGVGGFYMMRF